MSNRFDLRATYIEGWYALDSEKLLASTTDDFIFDDPTEPVPVTRIMLPDYVQRWDRRTRAAGSTNKWLLEDEVRQDRDGVLTDWEWWEVVGTDLKGMAIVKTRDTGVFMERITYFRRE